MEFFENTTTLVSHISEVDKDGVGVTNRGYLRYPESDQDGYYQESECDICNGEPIVARHTKTLEGMCADCVEEEIESAKEENAGEFMSYSLDTLEFLSQDYAMKLGNGHETIGGQNLSKAYDQVQSAIAVRQKKDFCKHGWFIHQEGLCHWCEME
jgi:hypothetical protein